MKKTGFLSHINITSSTYKSVTLGLQEWFIIPIDGNMPPATAAEVFGKVSVLSIRQCSITLALHAI